MLTDLPYRVQEPAEPVGGGWQSGSCVRPAAGQAVGSVCKPSQPGPGGPGYGKPQPATKEEETKCLLIYR